MGQFFKDVQGNMAMVFAVALMMIIAAVGAAVDISSMQSQRLKYQGYADAAVLAAVISGEDNIEKLNKIARKTVIANFGEDKKSRKEQKLKTKLTILEDGTFHVDVSTKYDMMIMGMLGKKKQKISVTAEAPPAGAAKLLNIAMVLDATESMNGAKMTSLKKAATGLVDEISGGADGETMFSVVPFAQYVKLPLSTASESWINPQPDDEDCWNEIDYDKSVNCRVEGTGEDATTVCDVQVNKLVCAYRTWEGCVGSRADPWYKRDYYGTSKIQGFTTNDWCHSEMLPLTKTVADVNTAIENMSTAQDTYIPAGLIWGWRALMPAAPLTQSDTADQNKRTNALLLMTDGENSRSFGGISGSFEGEFHWEEDTAAADKLTTELCTSIKADGILIFTIAFEVNDLKTISMLKDCASDPAKFFDASNASQLKAAFSDVGNGLGGDIRLSK